MRQTTATWTRRLPVALAMILVAAPSGALAARPGPFSGMAGAWSGSGVIYTEQGREPIRCRARYVVGTAGDTVRQNLVCASPDYRFDVDSAVADHGRTVSGTWEETSRNVGGRLRGSVREGTIEARIFGGSFTASLDLVTRGNVQTVTLMPQGTDVQEVTVRLRRR